MLYSRGIILVVVIALAAAACSRSAPDEEPEPTVPSSIPAPTTSPTTSQPVGLPILGTLHERLDLGYSLVLQEGWLVVDPRDEDEVETFLTEVAAQADDDGFATRAAQAMDQFGDGLSLWGYNAATGALVNVIAAERQPFDSPEVLGGIVLEAYESSQGEVVDIGTRNFPVGEVLRVEGSWAGSGGSAVQQVQYFVFGPERTFTITVTAASPQIEGAIITGFSLVG